MPGLTAARETFAASSQSPWGRATRRGVAAAAKGQRKQQKAVPAPRHESRGFGAQGPAADQSAISTATSLPLEQQQQQQQQQVRPGSTARAVQDGQQRLDARSDGGSSEELPQVSRGQVLATCTQVSLLIAVVGLGLHELAPVISPAGWREGSGEVVEALLQWPPLPTLQQVGIAAAAATAVTAARVALLVSWPEFRESTDRSNKQALGPLAIPDLLLVSALPALSEELLFRGSLIPAIAPDWRGAVIAGITFGVLHSGGGRNAAFAAWASGVGCTYGFLFLATGNLWVPAMAHAGANLASAALWKARHNCIW